MSTSPVRIDKELFAEAQTVGARNSRSAAQQISHWARIGREIENSPSGSQRNIQRVLAGQGGYDRLSDDEQAIVEAEWDDQLEERLARLDFAKDFRARGRSWTDADSDGNPVVHSPEKA